MSDFLLLKWGTLKGWNISKPSSRDLLKKYHEAANSLYSAMERQDTPEQREILIELINSFDGQIESDWTGQILTKEQAIRYITEYGDGSD